MTGDYLWDRSGTPDPGLAHLESVLSKFRHARPMPAARVAPVARPAPVPAPRIERHRRPAIRRAVAAFLALGMFFVAIASRPAATWSLQSLAGAPTVGGTTLAGAGTLRSGQWLTTDDSSAAMLQVPGMGQVRVGPGSRIRIAESNSARRRLELQKGRIHAFITAEPRAFLVDTPYARAVDLGCEYTLTVDASGAGELVVILGYVQLEWRGLASIVPMNGGTCLTRPGVGPGTPYFADASSALMDALRRFDFERSCRDAIDTVLTESRAKDALTLWHLLQRTTGDDRAAVFDRLAQLKPPPVSVSRAGILAMDRAMLHAWWDDMRPF
jgi:hypothetical protein